MIGNVRRKGLGFRTFAESLQPLEKFRKLAFFLYFVKLRVLLAGFEEATTRRQRCTSGGVRKVGQTILKGSVQAFISPTPSTLLYNCRATSSLSFTSLCKISLQPSPALSFLSSSQRLRNQQAHICNSVFSFFYQLRRWHPTAW